MNAQTLIAVVSSAVFPVGLLLLFDFLKSKGVNVEQVAEGVEEIADGTKKVVGSLTAMSKAEESTVALICENVKTAAATAEANYQTAKSTNPATVDTRKATVTAQVQSLLAMKGIKVTPQIDKVISLAIDTLVFGMHTMQASVSTAA